MNRPRILGAAVALSLLAASGVVAAPAWANSVSITTKTPITNGSAPITFHVAAQADAITHCKIHEGHLNGPMYGTWVTPCRGNVKLDVTGYASGLYTIQATSHHKDAGDYVTSSTEFWIDFEGPEIALTTGGAFTLDKTVDARWEALNEPTNNPTYERQIRRGDVTHGLGQWLDRPDTSDQSMELTLDRGATACLRIRGTDALGNVGDWFDACVTRPLDERDLDGWQGRRSGWKAISEPNFINTTGLEATASGSRLVLDDARIDTIVVWGRKGPFSGKLEVKVGGKVVGTVSLHSKTPKRAVVFREHFRSRQRGKVVLTVVTAGQPVTLDAVGIFSS